VNGDIAVRSSKPGQALFLPPNTAGEVSGARTQCCRCCWRRCRGRGSRRCCSAGGGWSRSGGGCGGCYDKQIKLSMSLFQSKLT